MERNELQHELVEQIVSDMDMNTLIRLVTEQLHIAYDEYTHEQLITEVEGNYPHILN